MIKNQELNNELRKTDCANYISVLEFNERNQSVIDKQMTQSDNEELVELVGIKISYAFALEESGAYKQSLSVLDSLDVCIANLENHPDYDKLFERYLFALGVLNRRLKKIDASQKCFSELIVSFPDSTLYHDWFQLNESERTERTIKRRKNIITLFLIAISISVAFYFGIADWIKYLFLASVLVMVSFIRHGQKILNLISK